METKRVLSEDEVSRLEEEIPRLAQHATSTAYIRALAVGHSVLEVVNGWLVETSADGERKVIQAAKPKHKVPLGCVIEVRRCR